MAARTRARATAIAFASLLAPVFESERGAEEALGIYRELGDLRGVVGQLNNLGVNRRFLGDYDGARYWLEQSVGICRELNDRSAIASALSNLADVLRRQGHAAEARTALLESLALFREVRHATGQAWSLNHLGDLARATGQLAEARQHYQSGADIFRALGDPMGVARSAVDLGYLACEEGDFAAAHARFSDALRAFAALNHKLGIAIALEAFACAAVERQQFDRALTLAGAAAGVRRTVGSMATTVYESAASRDPEGQGFGPGHDDARLDRRLASVWSLDDGHARSCRNAGATMPVERAMQYALREGECEL
jgi:tetratricopeptide (TPR) repeat protein